MSSRTAYQCDAPKCHELSIKEKGSRAPATWLRAVIHVPDTTPMGDASETTLTGAVHSVACLHDWIDENLAYHDGGG